MTEDEDIIIRTGKTCELVLCHDSREKEEAGRWLLMALFWNMRDIVGWKYVAQFTNPTMGVDYMNKMLLNGH